jgi:uncharacterized protein (DUF427 family)
MPRAVFNGVIIAESDETVVVESNHYFPPDSIKREYFADSDVTTHCPWKGDAKYYDVVVDGKIADYAAWYYPEPKDAARNIKDHIAFWRGVTVED